MIPRRERIKQAAIDEIKTIAWELINEKGISNITINGITKQMGMTPPAFYSYFKNRDDLMKSLVLDAYEGYQQALESALHSIPEDRFAERIIELFMAYRKWAVTNPAAFGLFAGRLVPGFEPAEGRMVERADVLYKLFHNIFLNAWKGGVIKVYDDLSELPKSYQAQLKSLLSSLALEGPIGLVHVIVNIILLAHGTISMEISGRYNHLIDFSILYPNQLVSSLGQIGLNPKMEWGN